MSKRNWIIAIVVLVFLLAAAWSFVVWLWLRPSPAPKSPSMATPSQPAQPVTSSGKELTYADGSGFSFSYPDRITVTDETPDDDTRFYSLVVLKRDSEQMKFTVRDTEFTDVEDWLAKDREAPMNAVRTGTTTLGGLPATQYTNAGKRYTVAIKDRVLYSLVGIKDQGFWDELHERVRSTLVFAPPPAESTAGTSSGSSDTIYEEEEVVE